MTDRRRLLGLLVLAAAVAPASASASTTAWYDEYKPIPEGQTITIGSSGPLSLTLKRRGFAGIKVKCATSGDDAVWNGLEEGLDETRSIVFTCAGVEACRAPTATAVALPWHSRLYGVEHPLFDEWSGVSIDFACGATDYGVFSGTLVPQQGDADEQCEGRADDLDNELRFVPGPRLLGSAGSELSVGGIYKQGEKGHGVTGEVFPCKSRGLGK